jgi:hypothetical protein
VSDDLGGSDRSRLRRVGGHVVKTYVAAGEGRVREAAALDVLGRLVGETADSVTMTDLGTGPSLADLLLGTDRAEAADGVVAWARALADLQAQQVTRRDAFRSALAARGEVSADVMAERVVRDARALDALALIADPTPVATVGGPASLTPGDACPDNNVIDPDGLRLLDFEDAQWRPVAWDAAYLTVPWPSCWCSWLLPAGVVDRALDAYRTTLTPAMPGVGSDAFDADLATATAGWALISASWFLPRALADDPPLDPRAPSRRAMVTHRLRQAVAHPLLGDHCALLLDELHRRWGDDNPLALAPAFR